MGLFSFFRDRRARESALSGADLESHSTASVNEIHGIGDLGTVLSQLGQLKDAGAQFENSNQVFDLRGSDARGEILGVLRQYGIDPDGGGSPSDPAAMQRDIFAALERAGLDFGAMGIPVPGAADQASSAPEELDMEELRRNPDSGIRNPLDR